MSVSMLRHENVPLECRTLFVFGVRESAIRGRNRASDKHARAVIKPQLRNHRPKWKSKSVKKTTRDLEQQQPCYQPESVPNCANFCYFYRFEITISSFY